MDSAVVSLQSVLVLLASSVLAVAVCRSLQLPPMIGYLVSGLALGPHALGLVSDIEETRRLARFGVVFLTVSIGIVSRRLAGRLELDTAHGREVIGMLLFRDLAVVPLLVLIPALGQPADALGTAVAFALGKAVLALAVVITVGPKLMRAWLGVVARRRSNELFVLNVLLVTLLLAFVPGLPALSLVLGAFLARAPISEPEFRFQVAEAIKPFRDVLLGLFFVTVGMM